VDVRRRPWTNTTRKVHRSRSLHDAEGGVTAPFHTYGDGDLPPGAPCGPGRTVSGLAFYTGSAYPASYRGALFYSDYTRSCIFVMPPDGSGVPDPDAVRAFGVRRGPSSSRPGRGATSPT
jgi:hypothetical protein